MNLSPDQQAALSNIRGLFNGSHREQILTGGPGMGKSFLTMAIIDEAQKAGFDVILCATTHPAVSVVENFTNIPAYTFHKLMDLKVEEDYATSITSTTQIFGKDGPFLYNALRGNTPTLIVIDEASYLNEEHNMYIEEALENYPNIVILYVGDKDQLPPVGYEEPFIFTKPIPTNQLTTDHRFASDSQIAEITNQLKQNIRTKSYFLVNIDTGKDITILDDDDFMDKMEELYTSRTYADDPFYVKSVAFRNKTVDQMNKHIRHYFYENEEYQVGERLLVNKALSRKNRMLVNNGDIVVVNSNEPTEICGVKGQLLSLSKKNGNTFHAIVTPHYRKKAAVRREFVKDKNWRALYDFMESFIEVKPIYASTIHKAQGASYKNVMLHLEDLIECQDHTLLARLLLVAVSRASHHVYVYGKVPLHLLKSQR